MAREHPGTLVLAGHHGPVFTDREIRAAFARYRRGTPNFALAIEGRRYRFDARRGAFTPLETA